MFDNDERAVFRLPKERALKVVRLPRDEIGD